MTGGVSRGLNVRYLRPAKEGEVVVVVCEVSLLLALVCEWGDRGIELMVFRLFMLEIRWRR